MGLPFFLLLCVASRSLCNPHVPMLYASRLQYCLLPACPLVRPLDRLLFIAMAAGNREGVKIFRQKHWTFAEPSDSDWAPWRGQSGTSRWKANRSGAGPVRTGSLKAGRRLCAFILSPKQLTWPCARTCGRGRLRWVAPPTPLSPSASAFFPVCQ